ncbi:MAG: hypothetical protein KME64_15200 [Scytonematopsis contorta HA4267-MV1]|jgi:hypothetical protein|nr:hypothetical protein [Scytonematopsis contorta HA4267-MV1]
MSIFTYIVHADTRIIRQLAEWERKIKEYVNLFYEGKRQRTQGTEFGDCITKTVYLTQRIYEEPLLFRGVSDNNGILQAGATIEEDAGYIYLYESFSQYFYLDAICNAPWNVIGNQPETIKGSATSLVEEIVKESIEMGYNGVIKTSSIPRAKAFYTRIGFQENSDGSGEMVLTEEASEDFLRRQRLFRNTSNQ